MGGYDGPATGPVQSVISQGNVTPGGTGQPAPIENEGGRPDDPRFDVAAAEQHGRTVAAAVVDWFAPIARDWPRLHGAAAIQHGPSPGFVRNATSPHNPQARPFFRPEAAICPVGYDAE